MKVWPNALRKEMPISGYVKEDKNGSEVVTYCLLADTACHGANILRALVGVCEAVYAEHSSIDSLSPLSTTIQCTTRAAWRKGSNRRVLKTTQSCL